jgi:hypothetical protein
MYAAERRTLLKKRSMHMYNNIRYIDRMEANTMASPTITVETSIPEDVYRTLQAQGLHRELLAEQVA